MIKNPGFVGLGRRALRALAVFLAVALSTVAIQPSFAIDTIRFDRLNVVDGLSQGTVQTVVQDARGFIWLGTQEGLNRYDGHEFMVFVNDPDDPHSIHHSFVHAIFVDASENVWVGTAHGGLDRYDRNTSQFQHFGPELELTGPVRAIVQDKTGHLWIGTDNTGVVRLDPETGRHTRFRHVPDELDSLSSNRVTALDYGDDGLIWVATDHGLNRLHPSTAMVDRFSITDRLRHLARAGSHGLWLASYEEGLLYLDLATREVRRYRHDPGDPTSLSSNSIRAVMIDRRGSLWVGTDGGGLDRYEPQSNSFTRFLHDSANSTSLNSDHVSALLQDSGGVIWVGTNVGVAKWNPMVGSFATIARRSGDRHELSDNTVTSFAPEGTSKLWVGTLGGGVNLLDLGTNRAIHYRADSTAAALSDDRVMALARDPSGSLWIGTKGGGLNLLDPRSNQVKHFIHDPADDSSLSADGVTSLLIDTSGTLWVGTFTGGLNRLNPDGETFTRYSTADPDAPGALSSDRVVAIYQDRRGDLWIGTYGGGLMRMNLQTSDVVTFNHDAGDPASLSSDVAWAIHEDSVGNLWVGTLDAGLNVWRGDRRADVEPRFERFTMADGLPSATVYAILTDSTGAIWVSTNGGLASLNRGATQFRRYDLSYGLPDTQFNHGASLYVSSTMFFGGMSGFTAFEPDNIRINEHAPSVVLTRFLRFNERASIEDLLDDEGYVTLNHEDRMITFEYAAMDFTAPQRNRYRHRLVGFDRGWVDDGKVRRATYTNLAAGDYVFEVEASNNHGTWSEVPLSYNLRVLPAPWLTSWALAAYGLAALFGLLLVYRSVARRVAITRQIRDTNASLRDEIRERQAQELALNAEKENAQRYLDIVEVMILSLDSQGRITMVNQKGERILGFKESELIGLDFFETLVPESVRRTLRDRFESLDEYDYSESPVVSKDGSERLIAWHAIPLLATQHLPRGILISGADVTQERDLEHQVREAHKMEALGTLASGIAHDFNNVLSSIVGFAELSLTQVPPGSKASHYLEQLEVSAERASNLVQTILAFRGHEEQRVLQPIYVQTVVEEALQLIRPSMPSSIDIHADIDASCAPVIADPTQLHQLIMNLCTNAYQAMGEGGGELGITIAERELSIEESRSHPNRNAGHYLRMVVSDTGIGMDRSTMARIFDPFFTTKQAGGGSGLGMSVVHGIVTRLGGQIEVESEVGRGTQITVMLPCTSEDVAAVPETSVADEHTGGDETILFVDDEADLRVVVAEMLGVLGYRVYVAATGTEALATFEAHHDTIDLVITDQIMPKMLGRQLAEKLREIDATVPIILTSGGGSQHADHGSVDFFMDKPFNIKSLAAAVREAIGPGKSEAAEVVDSGPTERTP